MKVRRLVSFTALTSFVLLALTGIMLFLSPQGRVAYWSGWRLLGLSREQVAERGRAENGRVTKRVGSPSPSHARLTTCAAAQQSL